MHVFLFSNYLLFKLIIKIFLQIMRIVGEKLFLYFWSLIFLYLRPLKTIFQLFFLYFELKYIISELDHL